MPSSVFLLFAALTCSLLAKSQNHFQSFFEEGNMRIDYFHAGNSAMEEVLLDEVLLYGNWAGSKANLIDSLNYGAYFYKVYDATTNILIYSKGFDSYFKEYQTSNDALAGKKKVFHETALIPQPKKKIFFALEKRNKAGELEEIFRTDITPNSISVTKNEGKDPLVKVFKSLYNGAPDKKADVAIIGEGYTADEEEKFQADLKRFTEVFFQQEPCKSYRDRFNIYGVFKPSAESGTDEPRAGTYKNTVVGTSFNALGSERYLLTEDNKSLRDIAGHAPYDALYIMVNHSRYGGGGIYNFYCTFTTDNIHSEYLMVHEFGHSFFGLADEYYTSSTAYNDFYSPEFEPLEPNITALKDPENVKWKALVSKGTKMPTPWEKEKYDQQDYQWQKLRKAMNDSIAELQRNNASEVEIQKAKEAYDAKSLERAKEVQAYLKNSKYAGKTGAFEGAGYATKKDCTGRLSIASCLLEPIIFARYASNPW